MATEELWDAPPIVPALAYQDVPRAADWLTRAFSFRERVEARLSWAGGTLTWMELGAGLISLSTAAHDLRPPPDAGPGTQSLKVYVDDVDAHFERAKEAGATIISDLEDGFWGGRIYRAVDLEGHRWEFSQKGRDLAPRHWRLPPGVNRQSNSEHAT
jgi:uncharacterized glyoxalase superfamily protein PhnB